jgi:hypothetical protein
MLHLLNLIVQPLGFSYKTFTNLAISLSAQLIEWVDNTRTMKMVLANSKEKSYAKKNIVPKNDFTDLNSQAPVINSYFFTEYPTSAKWYPIPYVFRFSAKYQYLRSMVAWTAF